MGTERTEAGRYTGVLSAIKARLERNRVGELLLYYGLITPVDLRETLALQKSTGQPVGHILIQKGLISGVMLRRILMRQWMLRGLAGLVALFLSFGGAGGVKHARAADQGVSSSAPIVAVAAHSGGFPPLTAFPALFGSQERASDNLKPFTKWSGMFERFDRVVHQAESTKVVSEWKATIRSWAGLPLTEMAERVNSYVNSYPYILDQDNWGLSDYWESPPEFFMRGGDCEDFAIAKYASLRALDVPEERLRLAIVHDNVKNIPHAVLIVYDETGGALVLDNQSQDVRQHSRVATRYRPIFSINREAWWLHNTPDHTVIASTR
ncbi:MAG: transglutaminase-like cysteine peptidase [Rhodospirillales bacterium]|nr:transglutaminase-like cysteine peptidase [Rhodospirillales bacterium]